MNREGIMKIILHCALILLVVNLMKEEGGACL